MTVLSYRDIARGIPKYIFHTEMYLFIEDAVFPNSLDASALSMLFPFDQLISRLNVTILIKRKVHFVISKFDLF